MGSNPGGSRRALQVRTTQQITWPFAFQKKQTQPQKTDQQASARPLDMC